MGFDLEDAEAAAGDALGEMTPAELKEWAEADDRYRRRWGRAAQAAIDDAESCTRLSPER